MNIVQQLVLAYKQKQYQQIIQLIEQQLFLLQQDPIFIQLFSSSLRQVQRVKEAEKHLEIGLKVFKNHPELLNSLANLYLSTQRAKLAVSTLQKAIKQAPNNIDLHYNLARALVEKGALKDALKTIEMVLVLAPNHLQAKLILADILSKQSNYNEALVCLKEVINLSSNNVVALNNIANIFRKIEDYDQALKYFESALTHNKSNSTILRNYAAVLALSNRRIEAKQAYLSAVEISPYDWQLQLEFAKFLWEEGNEAPFVHIESYLIQNPHDDSLRYRYIQLLIQAGEHEAAHSHLDLLSSKSFDAQDIVPLKARILRELGQYQSSVDIVSTIEYWTNNVALISEKGYSLLCLGRDKEALNCFNRLVRIEPNNQGWWTMLSTCWSVTGQEKRYKWLCDYDNLVKVDSIKTSDSDTAAFNIKLRDALLERHRNQTHPIGQSLRNGTQTYEDLFATSTPIINELSASILDKAKKFVVGMQNDETHPFYSRLSDKLKYIGSWSVRLRDGGFHKSHYHPEGWLSGVYYVDVPKAVNTGGQGWLIFGRAEVANRHFEGDFAIKPENGTVVLFPSYMWHGTNIFSGDQYRLTVAFDIIPSP